MTKLGISAALISIIALAAPAAAHEDHNALEFDRLSHLAADGDAGAMFALGRMHERGRGTYASVTEAHRLYLKSANEGFPGAMAAVGHNYLEGVGVNRNASLGMHWIQRAADGGHLRSQVWLASSSAPRDVTSHYAKMAESQHETPAGARCESPLSLASGW
ncbi:MULTISPECIES: tetratricopeptide repeat protein [unclassified Thioalkalivibrio]|uniref:tetratricopeptide repeat protein n=1 Tax=unclassified Thioalkalivibrio TaxID=2621013 RepID=UPI00038024DE|nr:MULTISPECIES: SEL1-like repeat protein [unclassified Thioalkalivibrio]